MPQVIADYAARVLAPGIEPTRSYRPGGTLAVRQVDDLAAAVREAVREAPADATVAVIAADDWPRRLDLRARRCSRPAWSRAWSTTT